MVANFCVHGIETSGDKLVDRLIDYQLLKNNLRYSAVYLFS
jgi:hypothetical protein